MKRKSGGLPYHIAGREELLQRMYILLSAKKGGFIYNRELGSRIGGISPSDAQAAAKAEAYARKALESVPYAEVTGANIDNNAVKVTVSVQGEDEAMMQDAEIELRGDAQNGLEL